MRNDSGVPRTSGPNLGPSRTIRLFEGAEFLARGIHRLDPQAQMHFFPGGCNILVRVGLLGRMFRVLTITSDLQVRCRLRSTEVVPVLGRTAVQKTFARVNRRFPARRWFLASDSGEVLLAGELQLRGDVEHDRRALRRNLIKPLIVMDRKIGRLFVLRGQSSKKDSKCSTAS